MVYDFSKIVEEWAVKYKPMQHTPGKTGKNQRFFLFDSIVAMPQFMAKFTKTESPCVGYEFQQEGSVKSGKILPRHVVYFMVKADNCVPTDKTQSNEALQEAKEHMLKFLAWLRTEQEKGRKELRNVNTEEAVYSTYGPFLNNWYAVFVEFSDVQTFNTCVDPMDYVQEGIEP